MSRKKELITEANIRYKHHDKLNTLKGEYSGIDGKKCYRSDSHYRYHNTENENSFYYDPVEDTLSGWGWGIGLIYRKGVWAEGGTGEIPIENYQIY